MVLLDLESTGPDIAFDRIVEFAAIHCPLDERFLGGKFGMMVHVDADVLTHFGDCASSVHGISVEEIARPGPDFPVVWRTFVAWLEGLQNTIVVDNYADSDDEFLELPRLYPEPQILLAGHNACKFDFPLLLAECLRHNILCDCFERWVFADTLQVFRTVLEHGCMKLQCLIRAVNGNDSLRAHRAVDDCVALRRVLQILAEQSGTSFPNILRRFAVEIDVQCSLSQLVCLMGEL